MDGLKPDQQVAEEQFDQVAKELDEEDTEDLFYDCYVFIDKLLARQNPQWVQNEGIKLRDQLEQVLNWYKIH